MKKIIAMYLCIMLSVTNLTMVANAEDYGNVQQKQEDISGDSIENPEKDSVDDNLENNESGAVQDDQTENVGDDKSENDKQSDNSEQEKSDEIDEKEDSEEQTIGVEYQAHVQTYGWQDFVKDGELAGTEGKSKRVEAVKMNLINLPEEYAGSSISYAVHVQTYGWQDTVKDGELAGTEGESKRLEAIRINLEGSIANDYNVYYRTHVQGFGWLGWASNGAKAGSAAYGKRMEAIEVQLVKKGEDAPESTENAYKCPLVAYQTHMQSYGWQDTVYDDAAGGITGKSKRMESVKISLPDVEGTTGYTGGISYQAFIQGIGWQDWKSDGELAGTQGQSKRIEAMRMKLTGEVAGYYNVYYSLHLANVGWTGYVSGSDNAICGSTDLSKRIEAIKIQLVKKGEAAPSTDGVTYIQGYKHGDFYYSGKIQGSGMTGNIEHSNTVGTTGQGKRLEGITLYLNQDKSNQYLPQGSIQYAVHLSNVGWTDWTEQGTFCGSSDGSHGMEAVKIQLTGDLAKYYDIYYRTHVQHYGWLGWAKNGQAAGTTKNGYRMEAMQIQLVSKDVAAPGFNSGYYTEKKFTSGPDATMYARANLYSSPSSYLIMVDGQTHRVGIYQGKKGMWQCVKYWACGDGKASTPTVRGEFNVGSRGYYFDSGKYRCFWWTQFYGNYLFHSVLCWPDGSVANGTVGVGISHGCVRLEKQNAKWIYDNIPKGTKVVVYN